MLLYYPLDGSDFLLANHHVYWIYQHGVLISGYQPHVNINQLHNVIYQTHADMMISAIYEPYINLYINLIVILYQHEGVISGY
jgi:hypothetical protein